MHASERENKANDREQRLLMWERARKKNEEAKEMDRKKIPNEDKCYILLETSMIYYLSVSIYTLTYERMRTRPCLKIARISYIRHVRAHVRTKNVNRSMSGYETSRRR